MASEVHDCKRWGFLARECGKVLLCGQQVGFLTIFNACAGGQINGFSIQ